MQADERAAARFAHVGNPGEEQFDGGERQWVAVDPGGIVGVELLVDGGGGGGRPGYGDALLDWCALLGGRPSRKVARVSRARLCSSLGAGGSEWMWRSLMRTTPAGRET